jgi:hypothetical protein
MLSRLLKYTLSANLIPGFNELLRTISGIHGPNLQAQLENHPPTQ